MIQDSIITKLDTRIRMRLLRMPLYVRIAFALVLGVVAGLLLPATWAPHFDIPARIILRLLGAIAPPLILVAVSRALIGANVREDLRGRCFSSWRSTRSWRSSSDSRWRTPSRPGRHASLPPGEAPKIAGNPLVQLLDNIPSSLVRPLVDNNVIGVIIIAVAFSLAARKLAPRERTKILRVLEIRLRPDPHRSALDHRAGSAGGVLQGRIRRRHSGFPAVRRAGMVHCRGACRARLAGRLLPRAHSNCVLGTARAIC